MADIRMTPEEIERLRGRMNNRPQDDFSSNTPQQGNILSNAVGGSISRFQAPTEANLANIRRNELQALSRRRSTPNVEVAGAALSTSTSPIDRSEGPETPQAAASRLIASQREVVPGTNGANPGRIIRTADGRTILTNLDDRSLLDDGVLQGRQGDALSLPSTTGRFSAVGYDSEGNVRGVTAEGAGPGRLRSRTIGGATFTTPELQSTPTTQEGRLAARAANTLADPNTVLDPRQRDELQRIVDAGAAAETTRQSLIDSGLTEAQADEQLNLERQGNRGLAAFRVAGASQARRERALTGASTRLARTQEAARGDVNATAALLTARTNALKQAAEGDRLSIKAGDEFGGTQELRIGDRVIESFTSDEDGLTASQKLAAAGAKLERFRNVAREQATAQGLQLTDSQLDALALEAYLSEQSNLTGGV